MQIPIVLEHHYDKDVDAAYVRFSRNRVAESIPFSEDFILDVDDAGQIVGVEILNVSDYSESLDYRTALESMPINGRPYLVT